MVSQGIVTVAMYQGQSLCQRTTPSLNSYQVPYLTIKQGAAGPLPRQAWSLELILQSNGSLASVFAPAGSSWSSHLATRRPVMRECVAGTQPYVLMRASKRPVSRGLSPRRRASEKPISVSERLADSLGRERLNINHPPCAPRG